MKDLLGVRQGFQEGAIQRKVISWTQHPKYVSGRAYYDAAVAIADQLIEYTEYVRPVCLPMTPVDDDDAYADDLVTLAGKIMKLFRYPRFQNLKASLDTIFILKTGWGLVVDEFTGETTQAKTLKLKTLQVSPKDLCDDRFSKTALKKLGISFFQARRQLPRGFSNDIACVGNDWKAAVSCFLISLVKNHSLAVIELILYLVLVFL